MDKVLNILAAGHGHETGSALIQMYAVSILLNCSTFRATTKQGILQLPILVQLNVCNTLLEKS